MDSGQFIHVVVLQKGIGVAVTLLDARGKEVAKMEALNGSFGPEPVSAIAEMSGEYQLQVAAGDGPAGRYQVQLTDLRAATPSDRTRIKAEQGYMDGIRLYSNGDPPSVNGAAGKWQESATLWRALDDKDGQALSLYSSGEAFRRVDERQKALECYNQAVPLWRALGDRAGEGMTLNNIGLVYNDLAEKQKAIDYFTQALPLLRGAGDRAGEATALLNTGVMYSDRGEKQKALDYYGQSLAVSRSMGDRASEATTLNRIGLVYDALGDRQKALDSYAQALPLARAAGDRADEATVLNNIGLVYDAIGEKQKALDHYAQALPMFREAGDRASEAKTLNNIGKVYGDLGDKQKALDYYAQALPLRRAVRDRAGEATTLNNIGAAYDALGEKQKALDCYGQALPLYRAAGDVAGEAKILNNMGSVYDDLGEKQKALDYYGRSIPLCRAAGDRALEATTLTNTGKVYAALGEKQKALDYYTQALPLSRAVGNRADEALALNNIAAAYDDLAEKQKALDYYGQALQAFRAVKDREGEAKTLNNVGWVYAALGQPQKALDYYGQALPLSRAVGDRGGEATTLNNIGLVHDGLGERQKALGYYGQALPLFRAVRDRAGEATTLNNIGAVYDALGEKQKALDCYGQALPLFHAVGDRAGEAATENNTALLYAGLGDKAKALEHYGQAFSLFQAVQDPLGQARSLVNLMVYWKAEGRRPLAILFGKQGIDRFQQVRRNIQGLPKEEQRSFVKSTEDDYRELADLLVGEGRLPEAQEILDLLKLEEYADYSHRRGGLDLPGQPVTLTRAEATAKQVGDPIEAEIAAVGHEWSELDRKSSRAPAEQARYDDLSTRVGAANQRWKKYLNSLYAEFGKGEQANQRVGTVKDESRGLQNLLLGMDPGTVALYTVVLDQKCVVMVITPAVRVAREVPVTKAALRKAVFAFVGALAGRQPERDLLPMAQDLYRVLIAPIEKDLEQVHATTLLWSLDDVLRYVPLAALHDGKQYLAERFANVVITTTGLVNLAQPQVAAWQGLAMGVSRDYEGLGALTAVPGELEAVVTSAARQGSHGPLPGTILLDDAFTQKDMEAALDRHPPVVHVATHFVLSPGDDERSYLLLGGKDAGGKGYHLSLADLDDDVRIKLAGVELLTLSGCQTGMGSKDSDGREVDSLGMVAQKKGAKSVIATLWKVDDASTAILMETFYRLWTTTPGMTKSQALRQAQLALLHGRYANPYYWAPFIMIGNWK